LAAIKHRSRLNQRRLLHRCREHRDHQERLEHLVRLEHPELLVRLEHLENLRQHRIKIRHRISGDILAKRISPESMEDG
jgi:hypothetical protein